MARHSVRTIFPSGRQPEEEEGVMTRYIVAVEGCPMGDGRSIDHNALSPRDKTIPVLLIADWGQTVGYADGFERDSEGNISFEIHWNDRGFTMDLQNDRFHKHISVGQSIWDSAGDNVFLASGVIYSIFVNESKTPWDRLNYNGQRVA